MISVVVESSCLGCRDLAIDIARRPLLRRIVRLLPLHDSDDLGLFADMGLSVATWSDTSRDVHVTPARLWRDGQAVQINSLLDLFTPRRLMT